MNNLVQSTVRPVNAQELAEKYPDSFEVPTQQELSQVGETSLVKVCYGNERFWTKVIKREGNLITAEIDNGLICEETHGLNYGDVVQFGTENIYNIWVD